MPMNGQQGNTAMQRKGNAARPQEAEDTHLHALAKRIRAEQGAEGLRDFLAAMGPFAAPNELKTLAAEFGMDYDIIAEQKRGESARPAAQAGTNAQAAAPGFGMNAPFQADPQMNQIMQIMRLMPMLKMLSGGAPNHGGESAPQNGAQGGMDVVKLMQIMNRMKQ